MSDPARRRLQEMLRNMTTRRPLGPLPVLVASALLLSGCAGFFTITPDESLAKPVPKPVEKPVPKVEPKPAPKPVEKKPEPKPVEPKPATPRSRWPFASKPPAAPAPTPPPVVVAPVADALEPDPPAVASDSAGVDRLLHLAQLWHVVALHHPWITARRVPWDSAFIVAVTRVRAATDDASLRRAYERLLAGLNDPLTRLEPTAPTGTAAPTLTRRDSTLMVALPASWRTDDAPRFAAEFAAALDRRPAQLILDLRTPTGVLPAPAAATALDRWLTETGLLARLTRGPLVIPGERTRRLSGSATELTGDAHFQDGWQSSAPRVVTGSAAAPRVELLVDSTTLLPAALAALVESGQATMTGSATRPAATDRISAAVITVPVTATMQVTVRVADPDHTVPRAAPIAPLPAYYDTTAYPYLGARLLGGVRLWSAMRSRFVHRDLAEDDIDAELRRVLPRLEAATSPTAYASAMLDLATSLDDIAGTPQGAAIDQAIGTAALPFRLTPVEGRWLLSDLLPEAQRTPFTLTPGLELVGIDGYPPATWITAHRRLGPTSNEWTRARRYATLMVQGAPGDLLLKVRDASNRDRTITVPRTASAHAALPTTERPTTAPARALSDGVLYLDLEQMTAARIDSALTTTAWRALVLDLRGPWTLPDSLLLAPLATRASATVARVVDRVLASPCVVSPREAALSCADLRDTRWLTRTVRTTTPPTTTPQTGARRIVVLIDERTQGAAERLLLALEPLASVTVMGSASAGAASATVPLALPGGITVPIATLEYRRADGSQLQRVGITPTIEVRPTVRGVRNGEDEPIQRAQQWLQQQLEPVTKRKK